MHQVVLMDKAFTVLEQNLLNKTKNIVAIKLHLIPIE